MARKAFPFGKYLGVTRAVEADLFHHPGRTLRLHPEDRFVRASPPDDRSRLREGFVLCHAYGQIVHVPAELIAPK